MGAAQVGIELIKNHLDKSFHYDRMLPFSAHNDVLCYCGGSLEAEQLIIL